MGQKEELHRLLTELRELTAAQSRILESAELDGLDENLAARQQCLDRITALPERNAALAESKEISDLVTEIRFLEKRNVSRLQIAMADAKSRMQKATNGRITIRNYDGLGSDIGSSFNRIK